MSLFDTLLEELDMDNKAGMGVQCPKCCNTIFSDSRHDFKQCPCGECFVDGGYDYLRYGFTNTMPKVVKRPKVKKEVKKVKQSSKSIKKAK
jgi:hypothetical protein